MRKVALIGNGLLVAASSYCYVGGLVDFSKKYAVVGVALFLVAGALCFTNEILDGNENVTKVQKHVCLVAELAGVDLLLMDVAIASGVGQGWAILLAVPSVVDLIVQYFIDDTWGLMTDLTHVLTIALYCYFGIRDSRYILIAASFGHLMAVYGGKRSAWSISTVHFAAGVFCTGWFLGGNQVGDTGVGT